MARIFVDGKPDLSTQRLIDLSELTNMIFYQLSLSGQQVYRDFSDHETLTAIRLVRRNQKHRFEKIVKRFPFGWPIHEQAAYILRAFSGLQLFPDANHRTGIALSRMHLYLHGYELRATGPEMASLVQDIRYSKSPFWARCNAGVLDTRNVAFSHIAEFYGRHVCRMWVGRRALALVLRRAPVVAVAVVPRVYRWEAAADERTRKSDLAPEE